MPLGSDHTCAKLYSSRFRQTIARPNYQGGNDVGCEVHRTVWPIPRELRGRGPANGRARIPNDPQHSVGVGQGSRFEGVVENNQVTQFQVIVKISFLVGEGGSAG